MTTPKRPTISKSIQRIIEIKNLKVCCVCKKRGIGTNFHHIDGNHNNNREENIALLCIEEHDQHHRPHAYDQTKHLNLGADKIREFKLQWEQTVQECKSEHPQILAVINVYGTFDDIHSVRLIIQNINSKIIYERIFHLLVGTPDKWIDAILDEVVWLGKNIKLTIVEKPLQVEYCPCCQMSLASTLDRNTAVHLTASDWKDKSVASIYVNQKFPSVALTLFYGNELLYKAHLHKCNDKSFHFLTDKFEEMTPIKKKPSVRVQATEIMQKVVHSWIPGRILIGTGNADNPTMINEFKLPDIWEKSNIISCIEWCGKEITFCFNNKS